MNTPNLNECKSVDSVVEAIDNALSNVVVVSDDDAADAYFHDLGYYEPVLRRVAYESSKELHDEISDRYLMYRIRIYEYYLDSDGNNHVYAYTVYPA